ncbi:MAG: hypothetical protein H3Z52_07475 [archaeon]|nr:hypothetical protein [archaeon]MCP8320765.1 hypothetical protein [archaeon]
MSNPLKDKLIVIAGGGYFGTEALISAKESLAKIILIDGFPDCKASKFADEIVRGIDLDKAMNVKANSVEFFICDAVEFLKDFLKKVTPDYIVPAIPGHFVGKLVKKWLEDKGFKIEINSKLVREVLDDIPKSMVAYCDEGSGLIVTSYMPKGSFCEIPCDQPIEFCPTTGKPKAGPMYKVLEHATWNKVKTSKIIVSHKLQRDVGCFRGEELTSFLSSIEQIERPYSLAIGTSCPCHGILNLFSIL